MKRAAQASHSIEGQQALDHYAHVLQQTEDLTKVTIRTSLSDLRQCMVWCECYWREDQREQPCTPREIAPPLLIRYRTSLQTTLWLKPSTVNRILMILKRFFAWTVRTQIIRHTPTSAVTFVFKEAPARHVSEEEESAIVATVNATGILPDRTIITRLFQTGLRTQERFTLTRKQVHLCKRNETLRIIGKRHKVGEVPLNATARSMLGMHLEMLPKESASLFVSEKTRGALTERALGYLITTHVRQAHLVAMSPHDVCHRFGYRMAASVPLHRLVPIMGHA